MLPCKRLHSVHSSIRDIPCHYSMRIAGHVRQRAYKLDWLPGTGSIHSRYLYDIALLPEKHRPRVFHRSFCLVRHTHSGFVRDGGSSCYYPVTGYLFPGHNIFDSYGLKWSYRLYHNSIPSLYLRYVLARHKNAID